MSAAIFALQQSLAQALKERDQLEALAREHFGDRLERFENKNGVKYVMRALDHTV